MLRFHCMCTIFFHTSIQLELFIKVFDLEDLGVKSAIKHTIHVLWMNTVTFPLVRALGTRNLGVPSSCML